MKLSVIVIGRNEEQHLNALFLSLQSIDLVHELIYVDSASTDNSVDIAKNFCHRICRLKSSSQLCASAGRYAGTLHANAEWILYLDGDMELMPEFTQWINLNLPKLDNETTAGYIGKYTYVYADNRVSDNRLNQPKQGSVDHFGGAILLRKQDVLDAGNWNPSVIANEEIDLYSRIRHNGKHVLSLDLKMVRHMAADIPKSKIFISLFFPLNQRYYGFGQAIKSQWEHGTFLSFMRFHPYPFLFWLLLTSSIFFDAVWIFFFLFAIYISYTKRFHFLFIYLTDLPRGFFGFISYQRFAPIIFCEDRTDIITNLKKNGTR